MFAVVKNPATGMADAIEVKNHYHAQDIDDAVAAAFPMPGGLRLNWFGTS